MSYKNKVISIQKHGVNYSPDDGYFSVYDSNLKGLDCYHNTLNCVFLLNEKTNKQLLFVLSETNINSEGEILYWLYKPTIDSIAKSLNLNGIYIWNT